MEFIGRVVSWVLWYGRMSKPKPLNALIPLDDLKKVLTGWVHAPKDVVRKPKRESKEPR